MSKGKEPFNTTNNLRRAFLPPNFSFEIQGSEPVGQSFTPSQTSVGFVQLEPGDGLAFNGVGATLYVNLRSNSISGPIMSSTAPVFMPDHFFGITNFIFSTPAAVVPGTTYFFEVVVQSGDNWVVNTLGNVYPGGIAYFSQAAQPIWDLWFREGIIVPEPSAAWLILLGGGLWFYVRRKLGRAISKAQRVW
jgi:hypothetical protein